MKLFLLNTSEGLKPCYDSDFDEKKKLKLGKTYSAEIKLVRNIDFHRKYFKLINLAWEYQNEARQAHFKNVDNFRKYVEVSVGYSDLFYHPKLKEWVEIPKSIAFEKIDNSEFQNLYEAVKNVLFTVFLKHITEEEFMRELVNF